MNNNDLRTVGNNLFHSGMNKDEDIAFLKEGEYTHAINAFPYAMSGEQHTHSIANEPSTIRCSDVPYTLIGSIPITDERHILFSTDNVNSEIGLFNEKECLYTKLVNDSCLAFRTTNLIKGGSRVTFDCDTMVYWNDGLNPTRALNINDIPYKYTLKPGKNCPEKVFTNKLDCNALLITPVLSVPTISLSESIGGSLSNGMYRLAIAYSLNSIRVTDYLFISEGQSVFSKQNMGKSIKATIKDLDSKFGEYELVLISNINQQTTAERLGFYSTSQTTVVISGARDQARVTISLSDLILTTPYYWKGEDMTIINDYLLQYRVSTKPEINYQSLANSIVTKYVSYRVPGDYYRKGGNKVGYMRDEVYTFFIRWVYNNGFKTSWFNIPGRAAEPDEISPYSSQDVYERLIGTTLDEKIKRKFEVVNTAEYVKTAPGPNNQVIGEGKMGYWESTEKYPDSPIWAENACKPIKHHRMPGCEQAHIHADGDESIIILGVKFEKVTHPKDLNGKLIEDIVGFEIGRGSRAGNTSIISKGMIHNMGVYKDPKNSNVETLYSNYPFNDLRTDPFLSRTPIKGGAKQVGYSPLGSFRDDVFTFHSPTVQHRKIQLGQELRVESEEYGIATGSFEEVYKHPKHKLIRDFSLLVSSLVGIGEGLLAIAGTSCTTYKSGYNKNDGLTGVSTTVPTGVAAGVFSKAAAKDAVNSVIGLTNITGLTSGGENAKAAKESAVLGVSPGTVGPQVEKSKCSTPIKQLPKFLQIANSAFIFAYYFGRGTEQALEVVKKLVPFQQYAIQYNSHGFYNNHRIVAEGNRRRYINNFSYVNQSSGQTFTNGTSSYQINNVDRPTMVVLGTNLPLTRPVQLDESRFLMSTVGELNKVTKSNISGYYASVRAPLPAQYGQIQGIEVVSTSYIQKVEISQAEQGLKYSTKPIYGGDTYIGRYTEKKIMPYFSQFLFNEKDGFELNYSRYPNIPYPRYWVNTEQYDLSQLVKIPPSLPNDKHSLDNNTGSGSSGTFVIKNGHFYLFNSGIIDFYCESVENIDYRNWGERLEEKHYDPYEMTNLSLLLRSDVINKDNQFIYDPSLSAYEQLNLTNGLIQSKDYNPNDESCFTFYKDRVIYSLPQQKDLRKDNWRSYLANNFRDFSGIGNITSIKPINSTGLMILFDQHSPLLLPGVDSLRTDLGVKVTIGDGGLFAQPSQNVINTDYILGAASSRYGVVNTEFGLFYISLIQGKIFSFNGSLSEISSFGLSSWCKDNLPLNLLKEVPNFPYYDNPIAGVGALAAFDSTYKLLYFTKRDWAVKPTYKGKVTWDGSVLKADGFTVELGDPKVFEDASWTLSYNPKTGRWVSFHDWHPKWMIQTPNHFISYAEGALWRHNEAKNSFNNYYASEYGWEIEVPLNSNEIETLSSIEYNLESYRYFHPDFHHVLDFNFDEAEISNSEQISGVLGLNEPQRKGIARNMRYPYISGSKIETVYSKEEQRYRINQFWDITKNRAEFNDVYRRMWITQANGYRKIVNPLYVDYFKPMIQRKAFRHYWNKVTLRRRVSGEQNMVFKWLLSKKVLSLK